MTKTTLYLTLLISTLLCACSGSDRSDFRANCKGKLLVYADGNLIVSKVEKEYTFAKGMMEGSKCTSSEGMIFCYNETVEGNTRTKEQLAFDKGYYTLSDIKAIITVDSNGAPIFSRTTVYQANCPTTVIRN